MHNVEIERKFLVQGDFRPGVVRSLRIRQGYLCSQSGRTVRVRLCDDRGILTIKGPVQPETLARFEWETAIPAADAEQLLQLCETGLLSKTRHLVPAGDGVHTWEVDEFHGDNEGLVVAEIELGSSGEAFPRPAWLGEEVTGERRYYNSALTRHPYKDWNETEKR